MKKDQLLRQIENANKRIAQFNEKVLKWNQSIEKALVKFNKCYNCTATEETYEQIFRASENKNYQVFYAVEDKVDHKKDNLKKIRWETQTIISLQKQIAEIEAAEQAKEELLSTGLAVTLDKIMQEFKKAWFDKMISYYKEHYDYIQENINAAEALRDKVNRIQKQYRYALGFYPRKQRDRVIDKASKKAADILLDPANGSTKQEYIEQINTRLEQSWQECIQILADKCKRLEVDETRVQADEPRVTAKGFEVWLEDGKSRRIYARLIWAAENSKMVCPHMRYIVTSKKL